MLEVSILIRMVIMSIISAYVLLFFLEEITISNRELLLIFGLEIIFFLLYLKY